jgi:hypothetical protein
MRTKPITARRPLGAALIATIGPLSGVRDVTLSVTAATEE